MGWLRPGLVAAVLVTAAVGVSLPAQQTLVVSSVDSGDVLLQTPVEEDTRVALAYTHSVERTRVVDTYRVRDGHLEMTRMAFESYGWGLPADANVSRVNGSFVYDPPGTFETITVKPGRIAGHRLHVGDRRYDLVNRSNARAVRITVERRSVVWAAVEHVTA
ncbi:DUF1850 domain-containing protein [Halomicrobium sp. HM KBTZ05]|uniref:DUF1850 domain-containing protein n=1 Tax=Halomicrobium sp. HM KBTZ05 TaxID=3242663 RepID=UPI0035565385